MSRPVRPGGGEGRVGGWGTVMMGGKSGWVGDSDEERDEWVGGGQ